MGRPPPAITGEAAFSWRRSSPPPTLPRMAKTSADLPLDLSMPVAWDRDPIVVASRRARVLYFPAKLLLAEVTEVDLAKWSHKDSTGMERGDASVRIEAGVTFIGAFTTQWALRTVTSTAQAPKSSPPFDACTLLWPSSTTDNTIKKAAAFRVPGTSDVSPAAVNAGWLRVFAYLRKQEERVLADTGAPSLALFTALDGFDAPEVIVTRLSDILGQRTEAGQHAHPHLANAIAYSKNGRHLGALHDYAVRHPGAWSIVESCRAQAVRCPGLVAG